MLSTKADVKLDIHLMQKIKNRSWLRQTGLEAGKGEAATGKDAASEVMMKKEKRLKRLRMKEEAEKGSSESSYRKRMKRRMEQEAKGLKKFRKSGSFMRRKSLSVLHDDGTVAMRDLG